jgi:hypothetical protein
LGHELVQHESGERAFRVSENNVIFGEPVWGDISQRYGRVVERAAAEAATGFKAGWFVRSQARVAGRTNWLRKK